MKKILLIDDHDLVKDALLAMLSKHDMEFSVTGVDTFHSGLDFARSNEIDIVLMDYDLPDVRGFDGVDTMRKMKPKARLVLLSGSPFINDIDTLKMHNLDGFIPKTMTGDSFVNAVRLVSCGENFFPSNLKTNDHQLVTQRESQVISLLKEGKTNKEIANMLNIAEPTVKLHVKNLMEKFQAKNRTDLAVKSVSHGT